MVRPNTSTNGNGHLAACHHPLNVDAATLAAAHAAPNTPRSAPDDALPQDTSGSSDPIRGDAGGADGARSPQLPS